MLLTFHEFGTSDLPLCVWLQFHLILMHNAGTLSSFALTLMAVSLLQRTWDGCWVTGLWLFIDVHTLDKICKWISDRLLVARSFSRFILQFHNFTERIWGFRGRRGRLPSLQDLASLQGELREVQNVDCRFCSDQRSPGSATRDLDKA